MCDESIRQQYLLTTWKLAVFICAHSNCTISLHSILRYYEIFCNLIYINDKFPICLAMSRYFKVDISKLTEQESVTQVVKYTQLEKNIRKHEVSCVISRVA